MDETDLGQEQKETRPARLRALLSHFYGHLLMRWLRLRNLQFLREARPWAQHLEQELFPEIQQENAGELIVQLNRFSEENGLPATADNYRFHFKGCAHLVERLRSVGLNELRLDSRLETGQILEVLLVALYAGGALHPAKAIETNAYQGWRRKLMAVQIRNAEGYHKFCAIIRYDDETHCLKATYHYCELYLSRLVKNYVEGKSRYKDHRSLFHAAPRAAFMVMLLLLLPIMLLRWSPLAAEVMWIFLVLIFALIFGVYTYALGTFLYTREHHDMLLQNYVEQVRKLSRFPEINPNPVFEISRSGEIVYANTAVFLLLEMLGHDEDNPLSLLPPYCQEIIDECFEKPGHPVEISHAVDGRALTYVFRSFPGESSVFVAAKDLTYLKQVETELRETNKALQNKKEEVENAYFLVDQELMAVGAIQRQLLPEDLPVVPGLNIAAYYEASARAGGDYYDIFPLPDGSSGIFIADVSGHGTPAAVLMAITHTITHLFHARENVITPARLMQFANRTLCELYTRDTGYFVTAFYGIFNPAERTFWWASAGHNPPRYMKVDSGAVQELTGNSGLPLGVMSDAGYKDNLLNLSQGDALLLYTDGVTEAMDEDRELFGVKRLDAALQESSGTPEEALQAILTAVQGFMAGRSPHDDRTLLAMRIE